MSDHSRDLRAVIKSSGICETKRDQAREHALEPGKCASDGVSLFDVLPNLVLMNQVHKAADKSLGSARDGFASDGILAQYGGEQRPSGGALSEFGDGFEDGFADKLPDAFEEPFGKIDDAIDGIGEDPFRAIPEIAEVEYISPAQAVEEIHQCFFDGAAHHAESCNLIRDPAADLIEDAVFVEGLGDQRSTRDELDDGAQHIGGRALDMLHVDGVDAEHDGEHAEAGNNRGFVG